MTDKELMRMAMNAMENRNGKPRLTATERSAYTAVCCALRSRLGQPEDEPVAWMVYIPSQQSQYVTDDIDDPQLVDDLTNTDAELTPLYTHPQPVIVTEWIGLTDDEIKGIIGAWGDTPIKGYTRKLFDQIETKLKEKNYD
jgi:hypothetical protein